MKTKIIINKKKVSGIYEKKNRNRSKLKNGKKVLKYSKKIQKGGSSIVVNPYNPNPYKSFSSKITQYDLDKNKELENLYNCVVIDQTKEEIGNFEKYECQDNETTRIFTLYRKKHVLKNEIFKVFELSNTNIGIEYNKEKKKDEIGKFYDISLLDLNVDLLQLAINTGSLDIHNSISKEGNNTYLGFTNNFPALVYNNDRTI
jgi:hypothetical protein